MGKKKSMAQVACIIGKYVDGETVDKGKIKPFDIGEHKDDKRYIEYPDNNKTARKYKDHCKLVYTKDSAGKAINFKWVTYKH